ncbi:UNVERIFIED_ORG: hypothetical protein J2W38_002975 [Variovorax paradoxus]|nr:hypothetical protein [Variovorax paradoxus]
MDTALPDAPPKPSAPPAPIQLTERQPWVSEKRPDRLQHSHAAA